MHLLFARWLVLFGATRAALANGTLEAGICRCLRSVQPALFAVTMLRNFNGAASALAVRPCFLERVK